MKKAIISVISTIVVILILGIIGIVLAKNIKQTNGQMNLVKTKVDEEIKYLDSTLIKTINSMNNISYTAYKINSKQTNVKTSGQGASSSSGQGGGSSSGGQEESSGKEGNTTTTTEMIPGNILNNEDSSVDWSEVKNQVENLYSTWTTVLIDLHSLNVNNEQLLKFNDVLDKLTQNVKNEKKEETIVEIANLYNLITVYTRDYSDNTLTKGLLTIKSNILYAYSFIEVDQWDEAEKYISNAIKEYSSLLNNGTTGITGENTANKIYVLLNELESSVKIKDKDIFYINYKNLMQEITILEE